MPQRPFFRSDQWMSSEVEDYNNAKSDDERRQMLLIFGYDETHRFEAERLFNPPPEPKPPPPSTLDRIESELKMQTEQMYQYQSVQEADQRAQRKQDAANRRKTFCDGVLVGIISSTVAGLILYYWPEIAAFFASLFS